MRKVSDIRRLFALLCLAIGLLSLCASASATEGINPSEKVSLTLNVTEKNPTTGEEQPLAGVTFSLYRVASMNEDTSFTLVDAFKDSELNVDDIRTAEDMSSAAAKLQQTIKDNGIAADLTAISDDTGKLTFGNMKPGLFIALGKAMTANGFTYAFSPVCLMIPQLDETGDRWLYELDADIKMERNENIVDLRVIKHWEREFGTQTHRPKSITVDLYCDGKKVGSAQLNRDNRWSATFKNLNMTHEWTVEERYVPRWYDVSYGDIEIDENGKAVVIVKNTLRHSPRQIPQTGLPWWPVPVLAGTGILLIVSGYLIYRKGSNKHE